VNKSAAVLGLLSAVVLAPLIIAPPTAHAATAVIMGPTFVPDPSAEPDYLRVVAQQFVDPTTNCRTANCTLKPLITPAQFWPITGLGDLTIDQSIAVGLQLLNAELQAQIAAATTEPTVFFGNSQSATLLTLAKSSLDDLASAVKSGLVFVLLANPNRPNGGLGARVAPAPVPASDVTAFSAAVATPTDTGISTVDITFQYDAVADFPTYPTNILSVLNTLAGARIHSGSTSTLNGYTDAELTAAINDPANRQIYGDTIYITIPAKSLPLADLLRTLGTEAGLSDLTTPMVDVIEPTLRALVELGYDRTAYGQPQQFAPLPDGNRLQLEAAFNDAASAGLDAALAALKTATPKPPTFPAISGWGASGTSVENLNPRPAARPVTGPKPTAPRRAEVADAASERRSTPAAVSPRGASVAAKPEVVKRRSANA
jgi:hypothetical protein